MTALKGYEQQPLTGEAACLGATARWLYHPGRQLASRTGVGG